MLKSYMKFSGFMKILSIALTLVLLMEIVGCRPEEGELGDISDGSEGTYTITEAEHQKAMDLQKEEYESIIAGLENEERKSNLLSDLSEMYGHEELLLNDSRDTYAFIDYLGFETIGNINIIDVETQDIKVITSFDFEGTQQTVKKIMWFDDDTLLAIVGYAYGTVTLGGKLCAVEVPSGEKTDLILAGENQEIIDMIKPDSKSDVVLSCAQWYDNATYYEAFSRLYTHEHISEIIESEQSEELASDAYVSSELYSLSNVFDNYEVVRLIKETEEHYMLSGHHYGLNKDMLVLVDKASNQIVNTIIASNDSGHYIRNTFKAIEEGVLMKTDKQVERYDNNLEIIDSRKLPTLVYDAIHHPESEGEFFFGYDVTQDLTKYVYTDEEGMKLLSNDVDMVIESEVYEENDFVYGEFPLFPSFVGENDNVFALISGYEGYNGFYYYDRVNDVLNTYDGGLDRGMSVNLYDGKYLNISPIYTDGYGDGYLLNVNDGSIIQMDRDHIENDGMIIPDEWYYETNDKLYIKSVEDDTQLQYLVIKDLTSEIVFKTQLRKIEEYGQYSIIGVLKNGDVLMFSDGREQIVLKLKLTSIGD